MFVLHSSNKTENLLEHLAAVISSSPLSSPFAAEIFLIQSQGMERWLSQQLASRFQVWGHFSYLFPAKFFGELAQKLHADLHDPSFDRHVMLWRFEALLRDLDGEVYQALRQYLAGENADLKRYQLALQLARIFDQYQMLRPDLLTAWRENRLVHHSEAERWQAALWRQIAATSDSGHRGEHWLQVIDKLRNAPPGQFQADLPERVSVFGVNSLPPLLLSYLQALALHCDVHLYLLNPVQGYWADLPGKRLLAQLQEFDGHPLLVRLGQQGREFQQMLLEQVEFAFEPSSFEASDSDSNLQQLQNDILANQTPQLALQADGSIGIHACHSRLREVQVLKNQLLEALENHVDLELRDIVVMAPDIQLYAPFISAVFDDIQHAIADRSLKVSNAALDAFIRFLQLSQSRFGWQTVLDLLEQPLVHAGFGLDENNLELIRYWLQDTHVRWGKSAADKQAQGLPPLQQNTWQASLQRLFMGYAVAGDEVFVDGVLPYPDIEGSAAQALGGLNSFLQLCFRAGDELKSAKTLADWQPCLRAYADTLLAGADPVERQPLNELLAELADFADIHHQPLSLAVIIAWLEGRMDETKSGNGFLRGQLTFCSMLPMRSIPCQVIALLGMNDGEFPKIERHPTFDLLAQHPRLGDRSRRADDRYQFLEILLSARRQLIVTYIGQSLRDNSEIPPSPIVSELLDVLRDSYGLDKLTIHHPLHPFSPRYFRGDDPGLFSYARHDLETAQRIRAEKQPPAPWWQGELDAEPEELIEIGELLSFYHHPQRFFLRQQLGVQLPRLEVDAEEREPFALNSLDDYQIAQQWLDAKLHGRPFTLEKLQAQGRWPAAAPGEIAWRQHEPAIAQFAELISDKNLGEALPAVAIDFNLGGYRLVGKLSNQYQNGSLIYRFSTLKGRDFVGAWLQHLIVNQIRPQATYLLSADADLLFSPGPQPEQLRLLLEIFMQGRRRPDAFFSEAAFCYLQQKNPDYALSAVIKQTLDSIEKGYEPEIAHLFAYRDLTEIFNEDFAAQCRQLLQPVWRAAHGE
ncbi:exodeoxyribonuclease V subunit gamma [Methylomonas montana]|uniref:exodeoxyribonuclease V subunit gamma n=1 Tax=Methylomonas montana TaxID=3058963 RepID=UPI00265A42A9|nr:exodeoxyribonuclease V subunit gamma [Methylomonas montana]WKJ90403.1 exodeoxyribonuclease V subunit gamma [Methylomonas montana]